jgi:hypothetical protein
MRNVRNVLIVVEADSRQGSNASSTMTGRHETVTTGTKAKRGAPI